jgi:hypothetical protein
MRAVFRVSTYVSISSSGIMGLNKVDKIAYDHAHFARSP